MTTQEISRKASEIAGAAWDDRDREGTLADQLRAVAEWRNLGTDGDLTEKDRRELRNLAEEAEKMTAQDKILAAKKLTYDADTDTLYADGVEVGTADTMTRELMLKLADESWHNDDDETLFDALVESHEE